MSRTSQKPRRAASRLSRGKRSAAKPSRTPAAVKTPQKSNYEAEPTRGISHYLQTWATELGKDPETVKKALIKTDYQPTPGERIPLKAIIAALFGEAYVEKVRALKLDNKERERRDRERDGELVNFAEVERIVTECLVVPLAAVLRDLPTTMDTRCNPQEPLLARRALVDWVEKTCKPLLRDKLPKPEPQI